ncbi:MAG: response regulator [Proteobacteria bacterium]|nr:response regulator [Pseudomonadota bacterium]
MPEKFDHTVLIVDDEEQIGKSIGRLLRSIDVKYVYMESGDAGLKRLKSATAPFSLILSDQRMPGMKGSEFLEKAKEVSPDTIRFLITGYADVDAVTDAVNKGSIHRYIAKPWDNTDFIEAVKYGLEQHEMIMENQKLFRLAKEQNAKLYALNTKLKESTDTHKKTITKLDQEIELLNKKLDQGFVNRDYVKEIEAALKNKKMLNTDSLNSLYAALISELFEQFQEIAVRNGFEMPAGLKGE